MYKTPFLLSPPSLHGQGQYLSVWCYWVWVQGTCCGRPYLSLWQRRIPPPPLPSREGVLRTAGGALARGLPASCGVEALAHPGDEVTERGAPPAPGGPCVTSAQWPPGQECAPRGSVGSRSATRHASCSRPEEEEGSTGRAPRHGCVCSVTCRGFFSFPCKHQNEMPRFGASPR